MVCFLTIITIVIITASDKSEEILFIGLQAMNSTAKIFVY
jgi:hypothetical protein